MCTLQSTCRVFLLFALLIFASRAQAEIIRQFNAAELMEQAPLACRVQVLSVIPLGVKLPEVTIGSGLNLQDGVATVKVSQVLKGTCPQQINIAVHTREGVSWLPQLHAGEWAIVFLVPLKGEDAARAVESPEVRKVTDYFLSGSFNIPAPTRTAQGVKVEKDPQMRLLDELVQAADNKAATQAMLQRSITQIGLWVAMRNHRRRVIRPSALPISVTEEPRIAALLPRLRKTVTDPVTYALYQNTAMKWGVLPTVEDAVRVLDGPPASPERIGRYPLGDQPYSLASAQYSFVSALRERVFSMRERSVSPVHDAFDSVAFCQKAFQKPSVRQNAEVHQMVAALLVAIDSQRIIPVAAALLYDIDPQMCKTGVILLGSLVPQAKRGHSHEESVKLELEADRLRYWKAWWEAQPKPDKAP